MFSTKPIIAAQAALGYSREGPPTALGWRIVNKLLEFISFSATGLAFINLFPIFFACGLPHVTVHKCLLMTLAQLATSLLKDFIQITRPIDVSLDKKNGVVRVGGDSYKKEYSSPSGHTSSAICIVTLVGKAAVEHFGFQRSYVIAFSVLYVLSVMITRVVLGMHYISDVFAGAGIGLILSGSYLFFGLDALFNEILSDHPPPLLVAGVFLVPAAILRFHPAPRLPCPCIVDSARFLGAGVGAIFGTWFSGGRRGLFQDPVVLATIAGSCWWTILLRGAIAMFVMVIGELVSKPIFEIVLPFVLPLTVKNDDGKQNVVSAFTRVFSDDDGKKIVDAENNKMESDDRPARIKNHWTVYYLYARYLSHIVFSFMLLGVAPLYIGLLPK